MCVKRKHFVNFVSAPCMIGVALVICSIGAVQAADSEANDSSQQVSGETGFASVLPGPSKGGVIDTLYVTAPKNTLYTLEKQPGSFVDCGTSREMRRTDQDGREAVTLSCGVTITETLVIPAASERALMIIHF